MLLKRSWLGLKSRGGRTKTASMMCQTWPVGFGRKVPLMSSCFRFLAMYFYNLHILENCKKKKKKRGGEITWICLLALYTRHLLHVCPSSISPNSILRVTTWDRLQKYGTSETYGWRRSCFILWYWFLEEFSLPESNSMLNVVEILKPTDVNWDLWFLAV